MATHKYNFMDTHKYNFMDTYKYNLNNYPKSRKVGRDVIFLSRLCKVSILKRKKI